MANEVKLKLAIEGAQIVSTSIDGVTKKMSDMGRGAELASVGMQKITSAFGGFSAALTIGKLISVQREFDVLNSSLITVTGSSAKAAQELAWIKQFAATTPYQLNEVTGAFVKMRSLGLEASQKALTSYGNTASAMGKGLNQMIEAVADASTGEFERLKEFGIKAKKEGDQVALTFQGTTKTIGNNAAEITGYLQSIGNTEFASAMETRAKTLDGAISNLADTWNDLFLTISTNNAGGLIFDSVTLASKAIADATTIIKSLNDVTTENAQQTGAMTAIQNGLAVVFETVAVVGATVGYVLTQVGNEMGGLAAQSVQILQGNFSGAAAIRQSMIADGEAARRAIDATTERILGARKAAQDLAQWNTRNASANSDPRRLDSYAAAEKTIDATSKITKANNDAAKAAKKAIEEQEKAFKTAFDAAQKLADIRNKDADSIDAYMQAESNRLQQSAQGAEDALRIAQEEFDNHGKLKSAIAETTLARLQDQLATKTAGTEAYDSLTRQIDAQKKLIGIMQQSEMRDASEAAAKDMAAEQKKAAEASEKYWEDALMRAFEAGKGFFESLWDTIKNTLKTQVLKVAISAVGLGGAGSAAAADVSNIFGVAGNASSMGSMFASAFPTAAATISTVGNAALAGIQGMVGMTGTAAQAATAAANGIAMGTTGAASSAASAGSMIAAAGPYVAAALGIYAIHQATQGETRAGGEYRSNVTDGAKFAYGPSGGDFAGSQVKFAIDTTTKAINDTLKQVGSAVTVTAFAAGYETSDRDRGGAYAGATLSTGAKIGQDGSGDNYAGTKYDPTKGFNQDAKGAVAALDIELKQSIIETLQAAGDIPQAVTKVIDDALARANVDSVAKLSAEATDSTMAALNTIIGSVEVFNKIVTTLPFKDLADLSFDAAAGLIEFSGGIDNLASNLGGFYSGFYSEAEQVALKTEFASKAFADLGKTMPAIDGSTRDWYKSLINTQLALDQSDPDIAKVTAGLLGMQGAVNELAPVVEVIKSSIAGTTEAIKNQAEWQTRLDIATGKTTDREVEKAAALKAGDAATDKIIEQFYALADPAITTAITQAQNEVAIATGQTTQLELDRAAALLSANDATDALVNKLYDLKNAAAAAATLNGVIDKYAPMTATQASASLPTGIGDKLLGMDSAGIRAAIAQYAQDLKDLGAAGYAGAAQLATMTDAIDVLIASKARIEGFSDEAAKLSIELLTAQGNAIGAAKALRELETKGFTAAEIAAYDYNKSLRNQITAINNAKAALESFNTTAASIRSSQDTISGTSAVDAAQRELSIALNNLNQEMKKLPDVVTTTAATTGSAAVGFFEMFPDALAYLQNFATTQAADFNAYVGANAELIGQALDSPAWANELYDLISTNGNATLRAMADGWIDPDINGIVKAAVAATAATTTITPGGINAGFSPFTESQARAIGAAIAAGTVSATDYTPDQVKAFGAFMSNASTLASAQNAIAKEQQAITDGLTKEAANLNIELLNAQGKFGDAKDAAKLLATDGMDALQIAMWDANEATRTQIATLAEQKTLQDELNGLRDTEAQALTRQRNALDESNRALFDQVQGLKTLASLQSQFAVPQTAKQAGEAVTAAGYNVTGMDTAGIASYISGILSAPGMLTSSGDLTAAGLTTVATLNGLTESLKILGTEGDKAAEQVKTNAATLQGLTDKRDVLNGTYTQTELDRINITKELTKAGDTASIAMQNLVWGLEDLQTATATQASIFDKLATDPQKQARAQTNVDAAFTGLGFAAPTSIADFLALSETANPETTAGQNILTVLGTIVDDFTLLHSAVKDVTQDYDRAMLEAAGNTSGLEAFDKAISDAALITAGWTQAQIAAVDATRANTKAAQITKDFNRALLVAGGDDSALAQFDRAISDAALIASGWTAAQVATIHAVEAAAKTLTDIASIKESRTGIASGRQAIVAAQAGFDAPAYWLAQQAMTSAKLSSTNDPALKIKYSSEMQTAIDNGLQAQISALDKARDTRIKALTDEAQLVDDNAAKAKQAAQEMYSALDDIAKYARGLSATDLSPLDPKAKLDAAANEYQRLLALTQGGDASAAAQLTSASDTYLNLAKDYYASTAEYASIFGSVESTLSTIGAQASVYEQIANSTSANYDLDRATAIIDQQYQTDLLALQNLAIGKYDALDLSIGEFQSSLESRAEAQYVEIQTLNVNIENVGNRVTQSGSQVTAAVNQSTNATQTNNALLMQVIALLIQANNTAAVTATATQQTASSSTLATAA